MTRIKVGGIIVLMTGHRLHLDNASGFIAISSSVCTGKYNYAILTPRNVHCFTVENKSDCEWVLHFSLQNCLQFAGTYMYFAECKDKKILPNIDLLKEI